MQAAPSAANILEKLQQEIDAQKSSRLLHESVYDSDLRPADRAKIFEQFKGQPFDQQAVDSAIQKALAGRYPRSSGDGEVHLPGQERGPHGVGVHIGESQADRLVAAFDGYWMGEDVKGTDGHSVPRFQTLQEAYVHITGRPWHPLDCFEELRAPFSDGRRYDSRRRNPTRMAEALTTSSWAAVFGDSMTRRAIQEYRLPNHQLWRQLTSQIGQATDPKRVQRRVRTGEYNEIPVVVEGGVYTFLASPGEQEISFEISKRGGLEKITLESLAADDQRQIRQIPAKLGRAAARTLQRYFFKQLEDNPNFADGTALFHANHNNLLGTGIPLDVSNLDQALQKLAKQPPFNLASGDDALGTLPKYLVHGPTLAWTAAQMLWTQTGSPFTTDHSVNYFQRQGLQPLLVPYWTHSKWFVTGDPQDVALFEVTFFGGEEPQLFDASDERVEGMMSADVIAYKVRHFWGLSGALDFRGLVGAL